MSYNKWFKRFLSLLFCAVMFFTANQVSSQQPYLTPPQGVQSPLLQPSTPGQPIVLPQIQQPQQQELQQRQPISQKPAEERLSEFEQYVAESIVELNESQFDILKRLDGIEFRHSSKGLIKGSVAVPVRVIKITKKEIELVEKPIIIDAGFLVGTKDALIAASKIVGIKNPFYVSTEVKQFGYELFRQQPSSFIPPVDKVPVGPEYVIGPGDELRITQILANMAQVVGIVKALY